MKHAALVCNFDGLVDRLKAYSWDGRMPLNIKSITLRVVGTKPLLMRRYSHKLITPIKKSSEVSP
jgi:hypothetical protein